MTRTIYRTAARNVFPCMGLELDGLPWFVRTFNDDRGLRSFERERSNGGPVGAYPPQRRTLTTGLRADVTAISWTHA